MAYPPIIKDPTIEALPVLTELLKDSDYNVQTIAAHGLARLGPGAKDAVPDLVRLQEQIKGATLDKDPFLKNLQPENPLQHEIAAALRLIQTELEERIEKE